MVDLIHPTKRDIVRFGGTDVTGRDISLDLKTLSDDTLKGILRSLGDASTTPTNATGKTLLKLLTDILAGTVVTQSTYGSLKTASYKPADAIGDLGAIYDDLVDANSSTSHPAGTVSLATATCPAGQVWVVNCIFAVDVSNNTTFVTFYKGSTQFHAVATTTKLVGTTWNGQMILKATQKITGHFEGTTLDDDVRIRIFGYKVDLY